MISRDISEFVKQLTKWFPVVAITGPRQSGKTTLAKNLFDDYTYLNLEDVNLRMRANADPMSFVRDHPTKLIVDEAQMAPDLFSAIQVVSDEVGEPGQYVLSGSQNFLLTKKIKQSMAGRCVYVDLYPLTYKEIFSNATPSSIWDFAFTGGYPRIYDSQIPTDIYFDSYIRTYIERDVKDFLDVKNLTAYKKMLNLCASQASNLLNVSNLSNAANVSVKTVNAWLSMLENSYIVYRLFPYYANIKKRLTKTPKLYFYDTGLLCYLLGIKSVSDLKLSDYRGAVIENLVISETIKKYANQGKRADVYFYRDDSRIEIDLLDFTDANNKQAFEVKSTGFYHKKYARHLHSVAGLLGVEAKNQYVLMDVESNFCVAGASKTGANKTNHTSKTDVSKGTANKNKTKKNDTYNLSNESVDSYNDEHDVVASNIAENVNVASIQKYLLE